MSLIRHYSLTAAVLVWTLFSMGGGRPLDAQDFFRKRAVDFWGTKKRRPKPGNLFPEAGKMPEAVRRLVDDPTEKNARAYLEWQRARMKKLVAVLSALRKVRAPEILYFTKKDCPHCREQDRILGDTKVVRIRPGEEPELWKKYDVKVVPTLVVGGRVFRGVTPLEKLRGDR